MLYLYIKEATLEYLIEVHALLQILSFFPTLHAVNRSCTFLSFSKKFYPALLLYPAHFEMDLKESVIYNLSRSKYLLDVEIYDEPCNQIYFFSYFSYDYVLSYWSC